MAYGRGYVSMGPSLTPVVKYLVIANVIIFLIQGFLGRWMIAYFGLTPYMVITSLAVWQFVTYLFLHGGFWHIFWNMFALWMFGSDLERHWGSRQFLKFYLVAGVGAGFLSVVLSPTSMIPTIGASGSIYGVLLAYGMMFPNRLVYLYFLFPVKVKYFVAVLGALAFFSAWGSPGSPVAHVAHLGGMIFGFLYMKGWLSPSGVRQSYHRWRVNRMRERFRVYESERRKKEDDFWIN
jgi:membrane associated rhomboid family serine protease